MKAQTDTRIDQLRQELKLIKDERDEANKKLAKIKVLIVAFVDSIADYLGRSNRMVRKMLNEVEELR